MANMISTKWNVGNFYDSGDDNYDLSDDTSAKIMEFSDSDSLEDEYAKILEISSDDEFDLYAKSITSPRKPLYENSWDYSSYGNYDKFKTSYNASELQQRSYKSSYTATELESRNYRGNMSSYTSTPFQQRNYRPSYGLSAFQQRNSGRNYKYSYKITSDEGSTSNLNAKKTFDREYFKPIPRPVIKPYVAPKKKEVPDKDKYDVEKYDVCDFCGIVGDTGDIPNCFLCENSKDKIDTTICESCSIAINNHPICLTCFVDEKDLIIEAIPSFTEEYYKIILRKRKGKQLKK